MQKLTTLLLGISLFSIGTLQAGPIHQGTGPEKVITSFSMLDGVAFFQMNDTWQYQKFAYRPFLDTSPAWVPLYGQYMYGLDGDLSFSMTFPDGSFVPMPSDHAISIHKEPHYMRLEYAGGKVLEVLVPPKTHGLIYRWTNLAEDEYKFRVRIFSDDGESAAFPKPDPPRHGELFDFGRGIYAYNEKQNSLIQTFENTWDDPMTGHGPCSAFIFADAPSAITISDKGPENSIVNKIQGSFDQLDGNAKKTINTSKVFYAEYHIAGSSSKTMAFCFADNRYDLDVRIDDLNSKTFDEWKMETESFWGDYLQDAHAKIEDRLDCDLSNLSLDEVKVLDTNLMDEHMLLATNGASYACPAAWFMFNWGAPGYYNSWIRDGGIAKLNLASIGLEEEYLKPHASLVANNYMEAELLNGHFRWWDVFYNYRDNCAGGTEFSQIDSAFYGIWALYKSWKLLGEDHWITGDRYQLMKDNIEYYRNSLTYDPYTGKNIRYFSEDKGMFVEYRINEADITSDESGWAGIPEWYRSPTTGKKFDFVASFYINIFFYSSYCMLAEIAEENKIPEDAEKFRTAAQDLKKAIDENLWREDKGRYIAGIAYNEDGYEDIDIKWENIGFDYIWALTLPDDEHLPFDAKRKEACLQGAFDTAAWASTNFGMAEIATDLPSVRREIVDRIVKDALQVDASSEYWYYFPYSISESEGNTNLPQIFAIAPALKAICLTTENEP